MALVGAFSRIVKSSRIFVMQVVVELLSYHNTATQEEVAAVTRLADTEAGTLEAQQLAKWVVYKTGLDTAAVLSLLAGSPTTAPSYRTSARSRRFSSCSLIFSGQRSSM